MATCSVTGATGAPAAVLSVLSVSVVHEAAVSRCRNCKRRSGQCRCVDDVAWMNLYWRATHAGVVALLVPRFTWSPLTWSR